MVGGERGANPKTGRLRLFARIRSAIRHGTSLRGKLVVLVLAIALIAMGAQFWFSWTSLKASITAIYESRARTVATVISRSIQEKEYILYYSDHLDAEIGRLLERYDSVIGITVIGPSARGFLTVASTDPTRVGRLVDEPAQVRYEALRTVEVERIQPEAEPILRAVHPILSNADLAGVVVVDFSLTEEAQYIARLSLHHGAAALVGILLLGGLLHLAVRSVVISPVSQMARSMEEIARREYGREISLPSPRIPGARQRDEISRLVDGYNLMTRVIQSHEQELRKLVVLDDLTGAYTERHFRSELDRELLKTQRYKHPTSVVLLQIDGLDALSSEEGNGALIRAAGFLVRNLRSVDVLFRIRRDRFAVLLPETPPQGAVQAVARLHEQLPDLLRETNPQLRIAIKSIGWEESSVPDVDSAWERLNGSLDALTG